jgi:hypothetical protein
VTGVRGTVVGPDGGYAAGARITLSGGGLERPIVLSADELGAFHYEEELPSPLQVLAVKSGFAPFHDPALDIGRGDVELMLPEPRTVRLTITDELSVPAVNAGAGASLAGTYLGSGRRLGPGEYDLTSLPPGEVTLTAFLGGRRFELIHDTGDPEARIVVPPSRAVTVPVVVQPGYMSNTEDGEGTHVELRAVGRAGRPLHLGITADAAGNASVTFADVFDGDYQVLLVDLQRRGAIRPLTDPVTIHVGDGEPAVPTLTYTDG